MVSIFRQLLACVLLARAFSTLGCLETVKVVAAYSPPRRHFPIVNRYGIRSHSILSNADFLMNIAYLTTNSCEIIIRRMDTIGWDHPITVWIDEISRDIFREYFTIQPSSCQSHRQIVNTTVRLMPISEAELDKHQQIPKIILQTYSSRNSSTDLHWNAMQTFIDFNPEYEYRFFDDIDARTFLLQHFSLSVVDAFDSLIAPSFKADIFRYAYILKFGGCYFDHKMILRKPLREIIRPKDKLILCLDALIVSGHAPLNSLFATKLLNAVICAQPDDIRLAVVLDEVVKNVHRRREDSILAITGPRAMYMALMNGKNGRLVKEEEIRLKHGIHHKNYGERDYRDYFIKDRTNNQIVLTKHYPHYKKPADQSYSKLWSQGHVYYALLGQFGQWKVQVSSRHAKSVQSIYTESSSCVNGTILVISYYQEDIPVNFLNVATSQQRKMLLPRMGNVVFSF